MLVSASRHCRNTGVEGAQEAFRAVAEAYEASFGHPLPKEGAPITHSAQWAVPWLTRMHACRGRCCGMSTSGQHTMQGGEASAAAASEAQARQPRRPAHGGPGQAALTKPSTAGLNAKGAFVCRSR